MPALPATRDEQIALATRVVAAATLPPAELVSGTRVDDAGVHLAIDVPTIQRGRWVILEVADALRAAGFAAWTTHTPAPLPLDAGWRVVIIVHLSNTDDEVTHG